MKIRLALGEKQVLLEVRINSSLLTYLCQNREPEILSDYLSVFSYGNVSEFYVGWCNWISVQVSCYLSVTNSNLLGLEA